MNVAATATLLVLLLSGCTATRIVDDDAQSRDQGRLTYRQLQDQLHGESVCVILKDERRVCGSIDKISRDSVRLWSDLNAEPVALPSRDVLRIESTHHLGGGILGFVGGTIGGLLVGLGVGEVVMPRGSDMRGLGVFVIAFGGTAVGLIGGTILGAIIGLVDRYEFVTDSLTTTSTP